jgi:hypothetical protein
MAFLFIASRQLPTTILFVKNSIFLNRNFEKNIFFGFLQYEESCLSDTKPIIQKKQKIMVA